MFWLGAAVSLCYVPGVTGAYIATQWPLLAVVLSFGLLRSGPFTAFHAIGLAFVAYAFVLWPFSPAPYASVFGLWLIVIMGLSVWFGTTMTDVRGLYAGLATGAAVSSALAVLQHFGHDTVATAGGGGAPAGLYISGPQQGTVLALVVVALASERMWLWIVPLVPGVVLAHSRGAWIALAAGLFACSGVRRRWVFGTLALGGVFYFVSPMGSSDAERVYIWLTAWNHLKLFGWGPGVFYTLALPHNGAFTMYPEYAHNDALQLTFEYGLGALLPVAIMGYALRRTDAKEWPVVFTFAVAGCYFMPLFLPVTSFLGLVAVGRILRLHGVARRDGSYRGQHGVPRDWGSAEARARLISVASHHSTEG